MRPGLSAIVAAASRVKARAMPHAANGQRHEIAPLQKRGKRVETGLRACPLAVIPDPLLLSSPTLVPDLIGDPVK